MSVHTLVDRQINYCNSLLSNLPALTHCMNTRLLLSAARLVLSLPSYVPVLAAMHYTLHWISHSGLPKITQVCCCTNTFVDLLT